MSWKPWPRTVPTSALGIDVALEEINKNKGILYDPKAVDACSRLFKEKGYTLREFNE